MFSAIVLAAGCGARMNHVKKQFCVINNEYVLNYSVKTFTKLKADEIIIVANENDFDIVRNITKKFKHVAKIKLAKGGSVRSLSSRNGFLACSKPQNETDLVLIHDAARPFVDINAVEKLIQTAQKTMAATLATFATDTIKSIENFKIKKTLNRNEIALVQTPQAFSKKIYAQALEFCKNSLETFTDDCQLVEQIKKPITIVESDCYNFKITTKQDLDLAKIVAKTLFNP